MTKDEEFNKIEMASSVRQESVRAALQKLHDENERLGLYDDVYGIPFVTKEELQECLKNS